jgi:hypothetical protein
MDLNFKEIVLRYLICNVKTDINSFDNCEMQCYSESTADGYDVYVLKYTRDDISVCENVYYYDHDIAEEIMRCMSEDKIDSIYIDENLYDDLYMDDAFEEYFNDNVDDIMDQDFKEFTQSERNFIHEEYDIEYM